MTIEPPPAPKPPQMVVPKIEKPSNPIDNIKLPGRPPMPHETINDLVSTLPAPGYLLNNQGKRTTDSMNKFVANLENGPHQIAEDVPKTMDSTIATLTGAPLTLVEGTAKGVKHLPATITNTVDETVQGTATLLSSLDDILKVALVESIDIKGKSAEERREKMRTFTDYIPFI